MSDSIVDVKVQAQTGQAANELSQFAGKATSDLKGFEQTAASAAAKFNQGAAEMVNSAEKLAQSTEELRAADARLAATIDELRGKFAALKGSADVGAAGLNNVGAAAGATEGFAARVGAALSKTVGYFSSVGQAAIESAGQVVVGAETSSAAVVGFAEKAKISSVGITSAMGLVSGAFAGAAGVSIIAHWVDKAKEMVDSMGDLSTATGEEVQNIVALRDVFAEMGEPVGTVEKILPRLAKSMEAARVEGSKQAEQFRLLGVDTRGWRDQLPSMADVLGQVAKHLSNSTNEVQDFATAQAILGRNSTGVIASLSQLGDGLDASLEKYKEHGKAVADAGSAADKLIALEAQLSARFNTIAVDSLPGVVVALQVVETAFRAVATVVKTVIDLVLFLGAEVGNILVGTAKSMYSLVTGDFKGAADEAKNTFEMAKTYGKVFAEQVVGDWRDGWKSVKDIWSTPIPAPKVKTGETNESLAPKDDSTARKVRQAEIEGEREHALALLNLQKQRYENEERLDQISAAANLKRLLANNEEVLAVKLRFNDQLMQLAKSDPNGAADVQELMNKRRAAMDQAASAELGIRQKAAMAEKKLNDELETAYRKMVDSMKAEDEKAAKHRDEFFGRLLTQSKEAAQRTAEDNERANRLKLEGEEKHAERVLELERKTVESQYQAGLITLRQREQILNQIFDAEQDLQRRLLSSELASLDEGNRAYAAKRQALLDSAITAKTEDREGIAKELASLDRYNAGYLAKRAELLNKVAAMEDRAAAQRQSVEDQHLKKIAATYGQFIGAIGKAFQNNVMNWIQGTQTFGEAFYTMAGDILSSWISTLLQMGVKWAERQAIDLALHLTGNATKASSDTAAATARHVAGSAAAASNIAQLAGVAAAAAFASTAAIPIVGPALAPGAAAAALSTVLGFEGLAFAQQGGVIPSDQLAYVHKNEMVLPAHISEGIQSMFSGGGQSSGQSNGAGHSFTFAPSVTAMDAEGVDRVLTKHRDEFIKHVARWTRGGHIPRLA